MKIFGRLKKKKINADVKKQTDKDDRDVCPEYGGQGYCINENHYLADYDYEHQYSICWRCSGIGRYHSDIDNI
ncbi:hypothetical protein [uncultured Clostridium sp.]|jgi:hypothetical protein|uniref:hypothetical protein n=1 Tax=uncultured Clostridium sp. TaxID=59620 RepID=UPI0026379382|nr:hypothetical protein [uncultured Clostridium sp.]